MRARSLLLAMAIPFVAACGSTSGGGGALTTGPACQAWADALCGNLSKCWAFSLSTSYGSAAVCAERLAPQCESAAKAAGSSLDAARTNACAAALAKASCDVNVLTDPPPECRPVAGSLDNGVACGSSWQCNSALCKRAQGVACGTCQAPLKADFPCTSNEDCEAGLTCAASKSTKICIARVGLADTCDATHACASPWFCKGGKCAPGGHSGEACDIGTKDCDPRAGVACDPTDATCKPREIAKTGGECGYFSGIYVVCDAGQTCVLSGGGQGACVDITLDGKSCKAGTKDACLPGSVCGAEGVCRPDTPADCQ